MDYLTFGKYGTGAGLRPMARSTALSRHMILKARGSFRCPCVFFKADLHKKNTTADAITILSTTSPVSGTKITPSQGLSDILVEEIKQSLN